MRLPLPNPSIWKPRAAARACARSSAWLMRLPMKSIAVRSVFAAAERVSTSPIGNGSKAVSQGTGWA